MSIVNVRGLCLVGADAFLFLLPCALPLVTTAAAPKVNVTPVIIAVVIHEGQGAAW